MSTAPHSGIVISALAWQQESTSLMVILYGVILPVHAFFFQVLQFLIEFKNIFRNICWIWTQIWHSNTGSWKPNILLISCSHFNSITHNELKKFTSVISHYLNNNCTKSVSKQTIKSGWELKVKKTVRAEIFIQKTKKKPTFYIIPYVSRLTCSDIWFVLLVWKRVPSIMTDRRTVSGGIPCSWL